VFHKVMWQNVQDVVIFLNMIHFTANLLKNLAVKKIEDRLRFDRIMAMSLGLGVSFLAHPVYLVT